MITEELKNNRALKIILIFNISILILVVGIMGGIYYTTYIFSYPSGFSYSINDYKQCSNLSLEDTSYCLKEYVGTFYSYRANQDTFDLERVKEIGGDCSDYSIIYKDLFIELGFNPKIEVIGNQKRSHAFVIVYNKELTGYCTVDQMEVNCVGLG